MLPYYSEFLQVMSGLLLLLAAIPCATFFETTSSQNKFFLTAIVIGSLGLYLTLGALAVAAYAAGMLAVVLILNAAARSIQRELAARNKYYEAMGALAGAFAAARNAK